MPSLEPLPQIRLRDDPTQDAIWKRWLSLLERSSISTEISGVSTGGTGLTSYVAGDILYANSVSTLARLAIGTSTQVLHGGSNAPSYSAVELTRDVTSTLPVASGGTQLTSYAIGNLLYANGVSTLARLAIGAVYEILRVNSGANSPEFTGWPTTRNATTSSETLTIGSGHAYLTASPFANAGTISNSGTMLVL